MTNWSAETFPIERLRYEFMKWFEDIVVSGEVGLAKPDPRIFALAIKRCRLDPARTVFIDDSPRNVEAGGDWGLPPLPFPAPPRLRSRFGQFGTACIPRAAPPRRRAGNRPPLSPGPYAE